MTTMRYIHVAMELWGVIFCLISSLCVYLDKEEIRQNGNAFLRLDISNAFLLFFDALAWIFRGKPGTTERCILYVSNFMVFTINHFMLVFFTECIISFVGQDTKIKRIWRRTIWGIAITGITLLFLSQFNDHMFYYFDSHNYYHRTDWFFVTQVIGIIGTLIDAAAIIAFRKEIKRRYFRVFLIYVFLPFLAMVVQLYLYGISLLNIANTISVLWLFILQQVERGSRLKEQAEQLVEKEREINDMQRKIMMSQIRPHFLYNSLNTIYHLCDIDSEMAQKAISDFSEYLRGNLDALDKVHLVAFESELKHIQVYLSLEKLRFDDDLEIVYDIQETDFAVPTLSIQPIVENAVKHGVGKAPDGGRVMIATRKVKDDYIVIISDNGVGFNPDEKKEDGRTHIGVENVKHRLQVMCQADLNIQSEKGKGTIVTIRIPAHIEE